MRSSFAISPQLPHNPRITLKFQPSTRPHLQSGSRGPESAGKSLTRGLFSPLTRPHLQSRLGAQPRAPGWHARRCWNAGSDSAVSAAGGCGPWSQGGYGDTRANRRHVAGASAGRNGRRSLDSPDRSLAWPAASGVCAPFGTQRPSRRPGWKTEDGDGIVCGRLRNAASPYKSSLRLESLARVFACRGYLSK